MCRASGISPYGYGVSAVCLCRVCVGASGGIPYVYGVSEVGLCRVCVGVSGGTSRLTLVNIKDNRYSKLNLQYVIILYYSYITIAKNH